MYASQLNALANLDQSPATQPTTPAAPTSSPTTSLPALRDRWVRSLRVAARAMVAAQRAMLAVADASREYAAAGGPAKEHPGFATTPERVGQIVATFIEQGLLEPTDSVLDGLDIRYADSPR